MLLAHRQLGACVRVLPYMCMLVSIKRTAFIIPSHYQLKKILTSPEDTVLRDYYICCWIYITFEYFPTPGSFESVNITTIMVNFFIIIIFNTTGLFMLHIISKKNIWITRLGIFLVGGCTNLLLCISQQKISRIFTSIPIAGLKNVDFFTFAEKSCFTLLRYADTWWSPIISNDLQKRHKKLY